MKFSEIPYQRPDAEKVIAQYRQLTQTVQKAQSGETLLEAFQKHCTLADHFSTSARLAQIRHTLDTRDAFYDQENAFVDQEGPNVSNAKLEFYRAVLQSPYKEALAQKYGSILLDRMQVEASSACEEVLELMQQENELASQYTKLYASCQVEFDGKTLTLPELGPYKQSTDRAVRKAAFEAEGRVFDAHQQELDDLYTKLIENRNQQARKMGFENYVPLSYLQMGRLGYGPEEVKSFRDQVAAEVTPLCQAVMKEKYDRLGLDDPKFYDSLINFSDGNPMPTGTPQQLLGFAAKMYQELSPETAEYFRFMTESELFDLESRPGKAPGGYQESLNEYAAPFVFANFNGTSDDVDVLTHEAGHGFQAWMAFQQGLCEELANPGYESCEIHSMSMEFLTSPWHSLFFHGDQRTTAKYALAHARDALIFLPYGCMVDEFQHIMYSQPQLTPEERNQVWMELERKYRPWNDLEGLPFYGRGAGWQRQTHIYQTAFYYIDYCLAQMVALQFFAAQLKDPKDAWQRYLALVKQGGRRTYAGLVEEAGFQVPFEKGSIGPVAKQVADWIREQSQHL